MGAGCQAPLEATWGRKAQQAETCGVPMGPWLLAGDTYDTAWKEASYCKGVDHGGTLQDAKATSLCL